MNGRKREPRKVHRDDQNAAEQVEWHRRVARDDEAGPLIRLNHRLLAAAWERGGGRDA